ncbi:MAG TPA: hypothetical protein HPP81_04215 [Deltaproteobacteria bacterium]|jgi:hypothetical protein|nr:hypothetical protein [Deltaproteobacteria bacterium]
MNFFNKFELTDVLPGRNVKEKLVWAAFCATCFQLVFRVPYVVVFPGNNANFFAGILCAVTMLLCFTLVGRDIRKSHAEVGFSLVFTLLTFFNAIASSDRPDSAIRGFILLATGLGGFWCTRILLRDEAARCFFRKMCVVFLVGLIVAGLVGYARNEYPSSILGLHKHAYNGMVLLFSSLALSLFWEKRIWQKVAALVLLIMGYLVIALFFDPMVWFPPTLFFVALAVAPRFRRKAQLVGLAVLVALFALFFQHRYVPDRFGKLDDLSTYIRVENYFFSLNLAARHPLLGIGLCAPRRPYLEKYDIVYPYVTKERFWNDLADNRTSENQFLTFMSDMGLPFVVLYITVLVFFGKRLVTAAHRGTGGKCIPALAILLGVAGELLHFLFYDGLLNPEVCWYFHIFLGMIPAIPPPAKMSDLAAKLN